MDGWKGPIRVPLKGPDPYKNQGLQYLPGWQVACSLLRSGYTYDDLICLPGHINFGVHDALESCSADFSDLGVSKNRGTPKWMVYNGKPY